MRSKLMKVALAIALALGFAVAASTPAQAFNLFYYYADCPGSARFQQLVIRNYSVSGINVEKRTAFDRNWTYAGQVPDTYAGVWYAPIQYTDAVDYRFYGPGNLNWYYHVDCFY